jgi:hypothetical protein
MRLMLFHATAAAQRDRQHKGTDSTKGWASTKQGNFPMDHWKTDKKKWQKIKAMTIASFQQSPMMLSRSQQPARMQ